MKFFPGLVLIKKISNEKATGKAHSEWASRLIIWNKKGVYFINEVNFIDILIFMNIIQKSV